MSCVSEKSGNSLCRRTLSQVSWVLGGPGRGRAWRGRGGASSQPAVDLPGAQPDWSTPSPAVLTLEQGLWQTLLSWGASWGFLVCFPPGPWSVLSSSLKGATFRQGAGQFRGIGSRVYFLPPLSSPPFTSCLPFMLPLFLWQHQAHTTSSAWK